MPVNKIVTAGVAAALMLGLFGLNADAKRQWTITQRQEALAAKIAKDERSGELTKKEADGLRSKMQSIRERIAKMKEKNGGKLSYKDEGKIESELNGLSVKLKKLELNKRVETH